MPACPFRCRPVVHRALVYLFVMVGLYLIALAPSLVWPAYLDSPMRVLVIAPFVVAQVLHGLGLPGLLEADGLCGWGWCNPSPVGWLLAAFVLLAAAAALALALAWLTARHRAARVRQTGNT